MSFCIVEVLLFCDGKGMPVDDGMISTDGSIAFVSGWYKGDTDFKEGDVFYGLQCI
jgi:hypothetical protein